jgi:hypothetical protein
MEALLLSVAASQLWTGFVFAHVFGKPVEGIQPEPVQPRTKVVESGWVEPVNVARPDFLVGHEPAPLEHAEVL